MKCPICNTEIAVSTNNAQTNITYCTNCNHLFKTSENLGNDTNDGFDINSPPPGTWIRTDFDSVVVGATTRSPFAFFFVPFMIAWSGISLGNIYGPQIIDGEFNVVMSLFGLPFLIGSVMFWGVTLMAVFGKVELTITKHEGKVFSGIWNLGITKKFTWSEISGIYERKGNYRGLGNSGGALELEGKTRISFATGVNSVRRYYLLKVMRDVIAKVKSNKSLV